MSRSTSRDELVNLTILSTEREYKIQLLLGKWNFFSLLWRPLTTFVTPVGGGLSIKGKKLKEKVLQMTSGEKFLSASKSKARRRVISLAGAAPPGFKMAARKSPNMAGGSEVH